MGRYYAAGVTIRREPADLGRLLVDVDVTGTWPPRLEDAWAVSDSNAADDGSGPRMARQIESVGSSGPTARYRQVQARIPANQERRPPDARCISKS